MIAGQNDDLVFLGDNLAVVGNIPSGSVQLIYIDPPFNTGKVQKRESIKTRWHLTIVCQQRPYFSVAAIYAHLLQIQQPHHKYIISEW